MDNQGNGISLKVEFSRDLNEDEQSQFWNDFIIYIEKEKLLFGGGHDKDYLEGFIEIDDSDLDSFHVKKYLEYFFEEHKDIIRDFSILIAD